MRALARIARDAARARASPRVASAPAPALANAHRSALGGVPVEKTSASAFSSARARATSWTSRWLARRGAPSAGVFPPPGLRRDEPASGGERSTARRSLPGATAGFAATAAVAVAAVTASTATDPFYDAIAKHLTVGEIKQILSDASIDFRDCVEKSELVARMRERAHLIPLRTRERLDALLQTLVDSNVARCQETTKEAFARMHDDENLLPSELNTVNLFKRCSQSVVHITTTATAQRISPGGFTLDVFEIPQGTGSGFVWDAHGHLVTNFHVIKDARRAKVTTSDGETFDATLVGYEADKDLAVLKLVEGSRSDRGGSKPGKKPKPQTLKPLEVGTTQNLRVGQSVFAIGNPFGLDQTLTSGIVSGVGRDIKSITGRRIRDVVQTDAAINPGNSGGPLLDSNGRLIGVNTVIYSPSGASSGVGFAIPSDTVRRVVNQIIRHGRVLKAGMGVHCAADQIARQMNVDGVVVLEVPDGSGAAAAGMRGCSRDAKTGQVVLGDVVVAVDGGRVSHVEDLLARVEDRVVGDVVRVTVEREEGGKRREVDLKVRLSELKSRL